MASENPSAEVNNFDTFILGELLLHHFSEFGDVEVESTMEHGDKVKTMSLSKLHEKLKNDEEFRKQFDSVCAGLDSIRVTLEFSELSKEDKKLLSSIEETDDDV